jgi:hypothetical protein
MSTKSSPEGTGLGVWRGLFLARSIVIDELRACQLQIIRYGRPKRTHSIHIEDDVLVQLSTGQLAVGLPQTPKVLSQADRLLCCAVRVLDHPLKEHFEVGCIGALESLLRVAEGCFQAELTIRGQR